MFLVNVPGAVGLEIFGKCFIIIHTAFLKPPRDCSPDEGGFFIPPKKKAFLGDYLPILK